MNTFYNDIEIVKVDRPKFYGLYQFSISLSQKLSNWLDYFDHKEILQEIINIDGFVSGSKHLLTYYLYFNDNKILKEIVDFSKENDINIQIIKQISNDFLNIILKKKKYKKRGKWYGIYPYRLKLKEQFFDFSDINNKLTGRVYSSPNNNSIKYMENLNDIMLFKLLYNESIIEIDDSDIIRG